MKTNPILEQVVRLSEQWNSAIVDFPDTRVFCWLGCSAQEHKMVKALVMFHLSQESPSSDIFLLCQQSFETSFDITYGKAISDMLDVYLDSWNQDEKLSETTGHIEWENKIDPEKSDAQNFIYNINNLSNSLSCNKETKLVIVLFPKSIDDLKEYKEWINEMLSYKIDEAIRFMLYDTYGSKLFGSLQINYPIIFKYIQPDIDLNGAINQVLENAKQESKDESSKEIISYQQLLVKMTEAIGAQNEGQAVKYAEKAIDLAEKNKYPNLKALIYYFLHSLYSTKNKSDKATQAIDNAIEYAKQAVDENIDGSKIACIQYIIVKANNFFFQKKYKYALSHYFEASELNAKDGNRNIQISLFQMIGTCKRKTGDYDAWDYFVKGWKLIETFEKEHIISNQQFKFYASEMLKVKEAPDKSHFENIFDQLWNGGWMETIQKQYEKNKNSFKILT